MAASMRPATVPTLFAVATFACCWTGALVFWRATGRAPSGLDMGQLLLALPAAILLAAWLARTSLAGAARPTTSLPAVAASGQEQPKPRAPLPELVASALRLRNAESAQELLEAIAGNTARCALDPELLDDDGFPIMSGRVDGVDSAAQQETMTPWLAQRGMAELRFTDEQWRALALGSAAVTELAQQLLMHPLLPGHAASDAPALPSLQLLTLLSRGWDSARREAAGLWFAHLIEQQGWPAQRIVLAGAPEASEDKFFLLDHLHQHSASLSMLVSCESAIGEDSVSDWSARRTLFTARNPRGQVPGEGAAALLLADREQSLQFDGSPRVTLLGASDGARTASADAGANVNKDLLTRLGQDALRDSKTEATGVCLLSGDADQRASRSAELLGMASALLPELDPNTQLVPVGACCGATGVVGAMAALALAQHAAVANGGTALWTSNLDPYRRSAVVIRAA